MNERDFRDCEALRSDLAALLENSTLKAALGILRDETRAVVSPESDKDAVVAAARFNQSAGANKVFDGLVRLTTPVREVKKIEGRPSLTPVKVTHDTI